MASQADPSGAATPDPGFSLDEMKQFVRNHFEEFVNRKNLDVADVNFAPEFVDHGTDLDLIAEGDRVVARNLWTGTDAATHGKVAFGGVVIWRFAHRQLVERWAYLEPHAHGGWIGSAADLARFATAVDGQRGNALLTPAALHAMIATPRPPSGGTGAGNAPVTAGLGWDMKPVPGGVEWSHAGALEGSCASWLFRGADGMTLAFVFNSLPVDYATFFPETGEALLAVAHALPTWPAGDLFAASEPAATPGA